MLMCEPRVGPSTRFRLRALFQHRCIELNGQVRLVGVDFNVIEFLEHEFSSAGAHNGQL